ncbi:MAG TPA: hypothetical protein VFN61_14565 [Acidimicrobiales bacterium]|nr:hypothetical protein [Acidimicrobiales bacterium]
MSQSPYRETDWTEWDAEGMPDLEQQPPGIDAETAEEGSFPAREHPLGADQWGTTAREQLVGEPLAERVAREEPEAKPGPLD